MTAVYMPYSVAVISLTVPINSSIKTEKHTYLHVDEPEFFYSDISIHVEELIEFTHLQIKNNNYSQNHGVYPVRKSKHNVSCSQSPSYHPTQQARNKYAIFL